MNIPVHILKLFFAGMILWLLSYPEHGIAQKKINPEHYDGMDSDSVPVYHYDVIRNRPDSVPILTFGFYPLDYVANSFGNGLIEGFVSADINKNLNLYLTLSTAFFEGDFDPYSTPVTFYPYSNIEIGGHYYFLAKKLHSKARIYFQTSSNGAISALLDRNYLMKLSLRSSIGFINTAVSNNYEQAFIGYDINDPQMKKINFDNFSSSYIYPFTDMSLLYLSFGITLEKIQDIAILIENSKKSEVSHKSRFYIDLLVSPFVHYENIIISQHDTVPQRTYNVDKYTPRKDFGFRFGWNFIGIEKFGILMGAETGLMPNSGGFVNLKLGLSFNPKKRNRNNI